MIRKEKSRYVDLVKRYLLNRDLDRCEKSSSLIIYLYQTRNKIKKVLINKKKIDQIKLNELIKDKNFVKLAEDLICNDIEHTEIIHIITESNAVLLEIGINGEIFRVLENNIRVPEYMEKSYVFQDYLKYFSKN